MVRSVQRGATASEDPGWWVSTFDARGSTVVRSWASRDPPGAKALPPDATRAEIDAFSRGEPIRVPGDVVVAPRWSRASRQPQANDFADERGALWEDAAGWPLRSMASHFRDRVAGQAASSWGLPISEQRGYLNLPRVLPLRPLPLGTLAGAFFYGAILWASIRGPIWAHRALRRRRGRCPGCGYPAGDSATCAECGGPVTGRTGTT